MEQSNGYMCHKREKSLEMLSIGFLKLFLHWKEVMTLEEAARRLSSLQIDDHKIKTKVINIFFSIYMHKYLILTIYKDKFVKIQIILLIKLYILSI